MAHHTIKSSYSSLADRLNRFPQGAPPSELLFAILKILFSEREAELVAHLPIKPFTAVKKDFGTIGKPCHSGGYRASWRNSIRVAASYGRFL